VNASTYLERVARALRTARLGAILVGQVDLLPRLYGVTSSFESLRSRSISVRVGSETVRVASLEEVLKSKRAAGRPKDLAVLPILEDTLREKNKREA
jgi:hypothetical protein